MPAKNKTSTVLTIYYSDKLIYIYIYLFIYIVLWVRHPQHTQISPNTSTIAADSSTV